MDQELLSSAHDLRERLTITEHATTVVVPADSGLGDGYCLYTRDAVVTLPGRVLDDLLRHVRFLLEDIDRLTPKEST